MSFAIGVMNVVNPPPKHPKMRTKRMSRFNEWAKPRMQKAAREERKVDAAIATVYLVRSMIVPVTRAPTMAAALKADNVAVEAILEKPREVT